MALSVESRIADHRRISPYNVATEATRFKPLCEPDGRSNRRDRFQQPVEVFNRLRHRRDAMPK